MLSRVAFPIPVGCYHRDTKMHCNSWRWLYLHQRKYSLRTDGSTWIYGESSLEIKSVVHVACTFLKTGKKNQRQNLTSYLLSTDHAHGFPLERERTVWKLTMICWTLYNTSIYTTAISTLINKLSCLVKTCLLP